MNITKISLGLFLIFSNSWASDYYSSVSGRISPEANEIITQNYKLENNIENGHQLSINGMASDVLHYSREFTTLTTLDISSPWLLSGKSKVKIYLQKGALGKIKKAPVAILINGMFLDHITGQMNRYIKFFKNKGHHIISLDSTWAPSFVELNPRFFPGDITSESEFYYDLIKRVYARIGKKYADGATLVTFSYSAGLGPIIKLIDEEKSQGSPLITGPTLLLAPSFDLNITSILLSGLIQEASATSFLNCFPRIPTELSDVSSYISPECSRLMVGKFGFDLNFRKVLKTLNQNKRLGYTKSQIENFNLITYRQVFAGLSVNNYNEYLLSFWMNEVIDKYRYDKFIIFTSNDDFINMPMAPVLQPNHLMNNTNMINVNIGGHAGFRTGKWKTARTCTTSTEWLWCALESFY